MNVNFNNTPEICFIFSLFWQERNLSQLKRFLTITLQRFVKFKLFNHKIDHFFQETITTIIKLQWKLNSCLIFKLHV